MKLPRDPLHQPPDVELLRDHPPASPQCARVRGLLRDYADGDLALSESREVEEHVHTCRRCADMLTVAEREVLLLRRVASAAGVARPAPGFARAVVNRLVLDETSLLSLGQLPAGQLPAGQLPAGQLALGAPSEQRCGEPVDSGSQTRGPQIPGSQIPGSQIPGPQSRGPERSERVGRKFHFALYLAGLVCVAIGLLSVATDLGYFDGRPERRARLILTAAAETYDGLGQRLARGDGLGDSQSLRVGRQGLARAEWHDASSKSQPAATFQLTNQGRVRVLDGETVLVQGSLHVTSHRSMTVPVADGSRIDLGVGDYLISAEGAGRSAQLPPGLPADLRVEVEVLRGDPAEIHRREVRPALVAAGMVGVYRGDSAVDLFLGAGAAQDGLNRRNDPEESTGSRTVRLTGMVADRSGQPVFGADVLLAYGSSRVQRMGAAATNVQGAFTLETAANAGLQACDTPFAIVQVVPPSRRTELGISVPEAIRLGYREGDAYLSGTPVLDVSMPVVGMVYDDRGFAIEGARVLPCVVDELFGSVLTWPEGQAVTRRGGEFQLRRLPVGLPRHQHLAAIVLHADLAPIVVGIPARNDPAADFFQANLVVPRLQNVRLVGLPSGLTLQVLEEVPGLPLGSAAVQRSILVDGGGRAELAVGRGQLWLRNTSPSHPMLRRLLPVEPEAGAVEGQAHLRPAVGMPLAFDAVFQQLQPLSGTNVAVASNHRFQRFSMVPATVGGSGPLLTVLDPQYGRSIGGAQVFATRRTAVRGQVEVRFLGFSNGNGTLALELEPGDQGVAVLAPDGSVGFSDAIANGDNLDLLLQGLGRVSVDPGLRPLASSGEHVATLRFERLDPVLPGQVHAAVRFASAATNWEVGEVPAGTYRVTVTSHEGSVDTVLEVQPLTVVLLR